MHILWMLVVGGLTGIAGRLAMPGRSGGLLMTVALGLAGRFLGGFFGRALGFYRAPFDGPGIVASALGAILILVAFRFALGRTRRARRRDPGAGRLALRRRGRPSGRARRRGRRAPRG